MLAVSRDAYSLQEADPAMRDDLDCVLAAMETESRGMGFERTPDNSVDPYSAASVRLKQHPKVTYRRVFKTRVCPHN